MAKGKTDFNRYQEDHKPLSCKRAIMAFCYDCMGGYSEGPQDCQSKICPLYPFMPYNINRIKRTNQSRIGLRPGEVRLLI